MKSFNRIKNMNYSVRFSVKKLPSDVSFKIDDKICGIDKTLVLSDGCYEKAFLKLQKFLLEIELVRFKVVSTTPYKTEIIEKSHDESTYRLALAELDFLKTNFRNYESSLFKVELVNNEHEIYLEIV